MAKSSVKQATLQSSWSKHSPGESAFGACLEPESSIRSLVLSGHAVGSEALVRKKSTLSKKASASFGGTEQLPTSEYLALALHSEDEEGTSDTVVNGVPKQEAAVVQPVARDCSTARDQKSQ